MDDLYRMVNQMAGYKQETFYDEMFEDQARIGIRNTLIPLPKIPFSTLSDTLIPWKREKPSMGKGEAYGNDLEAYWRENIQFAWRVKAEEIEIPF